MAALFFVATFCAAVFFGAAAYVSIVQHPAAMRAGSSVPGLLFRPMYRRAAPMQASLALVGSVAGFAAWLAGAGPAWLAGSLLLVSVVPYTLVCMRSVNGRLMEADRDPEAPETLALLRRWGALHHVRTALSGAALLLFLATATAGETNQEPATAAGNMPRIVRIGEMSVERAAHQATLLESGEVLVTGGCAGRGCDTLLDSAELYDPTTRSFRAVAAMAAPRVGHAAIALPDGRVLVAGGWSGRRATASTELYDPSTGRFTPGDDMTEARLDATATSLPDGRVLLTGGESRMGVSLTSAEIFDPETSTFSAAAAMGAPRTNHAAVALEDGRVLVTGGHRARGEVQRSAEIFDPEAGEFVTTGDMTVPRHKHAAALLDDDRVLIIGGSDERDHRGRYASTEIYDPATGRFSPGPDMRRVRHKLRDAVIVLPAGGVLVAGGASRAELFTLDDQSFETVSGELGGSQMFATATLLANGDVLVLGGYDDRIRPSASAWMLHAPASGEITAAASGP